MLKALNDFSEDIKTKLTHNVELAVGELCDHQDAPEYALGLISGLSQAIHALDPDMTIPVQVIKLNQAEMEALKVTVELMFVGNFSSISEETIWRINARFPKLDIQVARPTKAQKKSLGINEIIPIC